MVGLTYFDGLDAEAMSALVVVEMSKTGCTQRLIPRFESVEYFLRRALTLSATETGVWLDKSGPCIGLSRIVMIRGQVHRVNKP